MNGWRPSFEDRHFITSHEHMFVAALFDGHSGVQCAEYCSKQMLDFISRGNLDDIPTVLQTIDGQYLESHEEGGSTALICVAKKALKGNDVSIINLGDSRAILGALTGKLIDMGGTDGGITIDHKPNNDIEKRRIIAAGGFVENVGGTYRVNGNLAVSRALGNKGLKSYSSDSNNQILSNIPDVFSFSVYDDEFLVLVCDGVNESMSNADIIDIAADQLDAHGDAAKASEYIVQLAVSLGSRDNCSCIILTKHELGKSGNEFIAGPLTHCHDEAHRRIYKEFGVTHGVDSVDMRCRHLLVQDLSSYHDEIDIIQKYFDSYIERYPDLSSSYVE